MTMSVRRAAKRQRNRALVLRSKRRMMNNEEAHRDSCDHRLLGPVCCCVAAARHKGGTTRPNTNARRSCPKTDVVTTAERKNTETPRAEPDEELGAVPAPAPAEPMPAAFRPQASALPTRGQERHQAPRPALPAAFPYFSFLPLSQHPLSGQLRRALVLRRVVPPLCLAAATQQHTGPSKR